MVYLWCSQHCYLYCFMSFVHTALSDGRCLNSLARFSSFLRPFFCLLLKFMKSIFHKFLYIFKFLSFNVEFLHLFNFNVFDAAWTVPFTHYQALYLTVKDQSFFLSTVLFNSSLSFLPLAQFHLLGPFRKDSEIFFCYLLHSFEFKGILPLDWLPHRSRESINSSIGTLLFLSWVGEEIDSCLKVFVWNWIQ